MYGSEWGRMIPCSGSSPLSSWTQILMNGGNAGTNGQIAQAGGYGGIARMRMCPEAPAPVADAAALTIGTAHTQWTNSSLTGMGISSSYGFNGWLYDASVTGQNFIDLAYLMGIAGVNGADYGSYFYHWPLLRDDAMIPAFADANWRHVLPKADDPMPADLEAPGPPTIGIPEQHHPMSRLCMDRHEKGVNVAFMDGHAETEKVPQLWALSWSPNWGVPAVLPVLPP